MNTAAQDRAAFDAFMLALRVMYVAFDLDVPASEFEKPFQMLRELADGLRARLKPLKGITLTDLGTTKGAIVTFAVAGADHTALKAALRSQGINVSVSTQFSSRLDLKGRGLKDVMRASVHVYNTEAELDRFVKALEAAYSAA